MKIIDINNEFYPEKLREIKDPPKKLYVLGNLENLNTKCIAIIGSRKCTEYGSKIGTEIAYNLAKENITIVSGMAVGIDSSAHVGALNASGRTIAVLGSGFNNIFPRENIELFERILSNNGTVITEYEPQIEAKANNFRRRNRIVSGLSIGVLVVEAANKSGTGITVNFARQQKKPIFCVPNSLQNEKGIGTNRLLKRDAILITGVNDILEFFEMKKIKQINIDEIESYDKVEVNSEYKDIYNIISNGVTNINQIKKITNDNIAELNSKLLMMELEGLIISKPGNNYEIVK